MTYSKRFARGQDVAVFDVYRVYEGKIVEHWVNAKVIGPRDGWGHSGKF
ncbi:MAG: ester cyclase [Rhodobacteraceae bacterium]|nr:ester cyclase [Paracoccaceae bacterium]